MHRRIYTKTLVVSLIFALMCTVTVRANLSEEDGQSVIDEALFYSIRTRYDGSWPAQVDGNAQGETLRDGSLLLEVDGRLAELFFYKINSAREDILYIPSVKNDQYSASWLNYFNRISDDIVCGLSSHDLHKDPFPNFKCRMRIDNEGALHAFLDRNDDTSRSAPPSYDGQWEGEQQDFHWRSVNEYHSEAGAYSANLFDSDATGFDFQIFGAIASHLYHSLAMAEQDYHWGPIPIKIKIGHQIWCTNSPGPNDSRTYKCRISFETNGSAYQDHQL